MRRDYRHVGDDVKRERARELALHIMTDKNIAEQIASIILAACAEQRELDAKVCEGLKNVTYSNGYPYAAAIRKGEE